MSLCAVVLNVHQETVKKASSVIQPWLFSPPISTVSSGKWNIDSDLIVSGN